MSHTGITLRTYLSTHDVDHELRRLMDNVAGSAKYINRHIRGSVRGSVGTTNSSGDTQTRLDILADQILAERLEQESSFRVKQLASEERGEIVTLREDAGRYSVAFDPLDGSSLIDVNLSIGTIVGIHDGPLLAGKTGRESLVAALYMVYGPQTTLVYTTGQGVHEFILNQEGDWMLEQEGIRMHQQGDLYSPGGLRTEWTPAHASFITALEAAGYKLRYSGALVADVNQLLLKGGGIFTYPGTRKKPAGKLRLLFELQPLAFIVEQAGGKATDGAQALLNLTPVTLEQRCPIYIGSSKEVIMAGEYLKR